MSTADRDAVTRVVVNYGKAIGAYLRLLDCGPGRFDDFVHGDNAALSPSEQRGAALFIGKGGCVGCHSGPFLSDGRFHNVGLEPGTAAIAFVNRDDRGAGLGLAQALASPLNVRGPYSDGDDGRLPEAVAPSMEGAFKTPMLRCVDRRKSFMHTGQFRSLEDVVDFFARGGDREGFIGVSENVRRDLTPTDRADLVAFLKSLGGPGPAEHLLSPP